MIQRTSATEWTRLRINAAGVAANYLVLGSNMARKRPPPAHHPLDFSGGDSPRIVMLGNPRREGDILHVHIGGWHSLADKEAMTAKGYSPRATDLRLTDYQGTPAWMRFSNTFKMYLPTINTRAVRVGNEYVLDDNSRIGLLDPVPRGRTLKKEQYFDRDITGEMEGNCQAWVIRELSRMTRSGNAKFDALGRRFGLRQADGTTLNMQVAASAGDAHEKADGTSFISNSIVVTCNSSTSAASRFNGGFYLSGVTIPQGATIDSAVPSVKPNNTTTDDPNVDIGFQAVDNAVNFTDDPDVTTRAASMTATIAWTATAIGTDFVDGPDIATPLQAIVDRAGWASGQAVCALFKGKADVTSLLVVRSFDDFSENALRLAVDYTAAASGVPGGMTLLGVGNGA